MHRPSSHNEDFTVSEHCLAVGDWDILGACRLSSSKLTQRKKSLLKLIAPFIIEEGDNAEHVKNKII